MNLEIERKFIIDPQNEIYLKLIQEHTPTIENRYYLFKDGGIELRFTSLQKIDGTIDYTLDRMEVRDETLTVRSKERLQITREEFDTLLTLLQRSDPAVEPIVRHSYTVSERPKVQIKVYKEKFEGLIRAEVEFDSKKECAKYKSLAWMGTEISNTPIGNDVTLADLSTEEFKEHMDKFRS